MLEQGGWHYRQPVSYKNHPRAAAEDDSVTDRVSMAAIADPKLIQVLDDYVGRRRLAYYKTPNQEAGWMQRNDPITMYFKEPVTDEIKKELSQILAPFNRAKITSNPLDGDSWEPGLAKESSPTTKDLEQLIQQASSYNPEAGEAIRKYVTKSPGKIKASAGQVSVLKDVVKLASQRLDQQRVGDPSKQTKQQPATNSPQRVSLSDMEDQVSDPDWHHAYDMFVRQVGKFGKDNPSVQQLGMELYQAAQTGDMSKIKKRVGPIRLNQ